MGKHSEGRKIGPDEPFVHPHVTGETRPAKVKEMLDQAAEDNRVAMDKIIRDSRK